MKVVIFQGFCDPDPPKFLTFFDQLFQYCTYPDSGLIQGIGYFWEMKWLYRLFFWLLPGLLGLAKPFSKKLRHFLEGRKSSFSDLENFKKSYVGPIAWFHVASLGEYEQARPVISSLKSRRPELSIVVTFFSPSGYDNVIKKPQPSVDLITYLPLDRKAWVDRFVGLMNPSLVFFVKYDLWYHTIQELKKRRIPMILISASFRPDQPYFGAFGKMFREMLFSMDWIFTQNQSSIDLLQKIGFTRTSLAGDTRFDRVAITASDPKPLDEIRKWVGNAPTVVIGSAWEEDMQILIPLINSRPGYRWIIAPHDLNPEPMDRWASQFDQPSIKYSEWTSSPDQSILFIDNIGMLSSLYQFARVAYVGGAFGKGLHNILEPLGFGVPVLFGEVKKAGKFPEAPQSVAEGCGFSVPNKEELFGVFEKLENPDFYKKSVDSAQNWVKSNLGAAERIVDQVMKLPLKL